MEQEFEELNEILKVQGVHPKKFSDYLQYALDPKFDEFLSLFQEAPIDPSQLKELFSLLSENDFQKLASTLKHQKINLKLFQEYLKQYLIQNPPSSFVFSKESLTNPPISEEESTRAFTFEQLSKLTKQEHREIRFIGTKLLSEAKITIPELNQLLKELSETHLSARNLLQNLFKQKKNSG